MAHQLPPRGTELRDMIDLDMLVAIGTRQVLPATFAEAKRGARESMRRNPDIRSVQCICMRADGSLRLVSFGPRGGVRDLWNFTPEV
jgi:hypothetical protein